MTISRRDFLLTGAYCALGAAFGYGRHLEPYAFEISRVPFEFLDCSGGAGITWVHLSDLHAFDAMPFRHISNAISIVRYQQPDFVCITGDFVSAKIGDYEMYCEELRRLTKCVPTFASMGNHDGGAWARRAGGYETSEPVRRLLEDSGVNVLHNRAAALTVRGCEIQLVGAGDVWADECDPKQAFLSVKSGVPTILLSHNPDSKEALGAYPWHLMLSGHSHGGQLRVPLSGTTPFAPLRDHRYAAGLNSWRDRWIYTNRGIGTAILRFNCRPEVTVFST